MTLQGVENVNFLFLHKYNIFELSYNFENFDKVTIASILIVVPQSVV